MKRAHGPLARLLLLVFFIFIPKLLNAGDANTTAKANTNTNDNKWLEVEIGIIGTSSDEILKSALAQVQREAFTGLIITLDTPGGSLESTRAMVKNIMNAPVPIIVWVGPDGSRAASAGAFITLAANVAAMAPGTNIGAAHPIQANGKDIDEEEGARKVEEDTAAFMESLATLRKRNVEMARSFVLTSVAITAQEALDHKVIDVIAKSREDIFANLNGQTIAINEKDTFTVSSANLTFAKYEKGIKEQFLEVLSNPNLFYLLFVAGIIGLGFELTHPGALFPGIAGGICMILALIATSVLPVSFGAMALVLVGVALMITEMFVASFGILGIGGFVAFTIGSFLLVDPNNEQGLRISYMTIIPGALTLALAFLALAYLILKSGRSKIASGREYLLGKDGTVLESFQNDMGKIRVEGEIWSAKMGESSGSLLRGDSVSVIGLSGLTMIVKKKT